MSAEKSIIDPIEDFNSHPEWLFLLAWNAFAFSHPLKVKLLTLNEKEFSLEIQSKLTPFSSKNSKTVKVHQFTENELRGTPAASLKNVIVKYSFPSWPAGGIHSIILWIVIALCAVDLGGYELYVYWIKFYTLKIFQTQLVAKYALIVMAVLHVLETIYALYILSPIIQSKSAYLGWAIVNFIFGYPSTIRAMKLSALANKKRKET